MNQRIALSDVATRLRGTLGHQLGVAHIGTALDVDFVKAVADSTKWPAVWIGGQRSTPINDGRGYAGRVRQDVQAEFTARVVVQRYVSGDVVAEERLNRICDAVADALMGWRPTGASEPVVWVQSLDGPPDQSLMTVDLIFAVRVSYQYANAA